MDGPVLLTGWAGRVGEAIRERLAHRYDWRFFDREPPTSELPGESFMGDITDRDALRDAMAEASTVIHLAGDSRPEAGWESVLQNNIDGTQAVFETAVEAKVEKVVFASSNHAVGGYETPERTPALYRPADDFQLDGEELPRPGNLYGVSKVAGEALGRFYHDEYDISVICVRIGNLTRGHPPRDYERGQAMWLSYRDCAHLFSCCIEADYDYEIVYGISDNDRKYYSLEPARRVLGYEPQDNSADYED